MDEKFQDRIDNYLFNRMGAAEKTEFLCEVEQDEEKKEQLEFTKNVKDSICSREAKLQALAKFRRQYEEERRSAAYRANGIEREVGSCSAAIDPMPKKKIWLWLSGVAAVLVVGFFAFKPMFEYESAPNYNGSPMEQVRGDDGVFSPAPKDSIDDDTLHVDSVNSIKNVPQDD